MNHGKLINIAHVLGYTAETSGITMAGLCKGYTMMWARAVCSGKLEEFNARMKLLENFQDDPTNLVKFVNAARARVAARGRIAEHDNPLDYDALFLSIPAFFESIALYLHPDFHYEIFKERVTQHEEEKITALLDGDQPEMAVATCHRKVRNYTQQLLEEDLIELAETLNNQPGCAIEFNSMRHSVAAQINEKGNFVFLDVNQNTSDEANSINTLELTPQELAVHLMEKSLYFDKKNDHLAMATTVHARRELKDEISSKFQEPSFELTDDMDTIHLGIALKIPGVAQVITNQDDFDVHCSDSLLIYVAISYHNYEVAEAILRHKNFNPENVNFYELASHFVEFTPQQIKETLALFEKVGIDQEILDYPVFSALSQREETDNFTLVQDLEHVSPQNSKLIIQKLIADGHDFMKGTSGCSPLHHVFDDAYIETVTMFIDAGYDVNSRFYGRNPLMYSIRSPKIVELLLDKGADPNEDASKGISALDRACSYDKDKLPIESIKTIIMHKSTELNMNQITSNSNVYVAVKTIGDPELNKQFVAKALKAYIKGADDELRLGIFFSKDEKVKAAEALLAHIEKDASIDPIHNKALKDGRLGQIESMLIPNKTAEYRAILQEHQTKLVQEPVDNDNVTTKPS